MPSSDEDVASPTPKGRAGVPQAKLISIYSKVPLLTLALRIPPAHVMNKEDSTTPLKIRIMGELNPPGTKCRPNFHYEGKTDDSESAGEPSAEQVPTFLRGIKEEYRDAINSSVYFVAKDLCTLIHTRKGNVAKSIGNFYPREKARMSVLCPRSNGSVSTHCLTVLSVAGMYRLLNSSRSPLAPTIMEMLWAVVNEAMVHKIEGVPLAPKSTPKPSSDNGSSSNSPEDDNTVTGPQLYYAIRPSGPAMIYVPLTYEEYVKIGTEQALQQTNQIQANRQSMTVVQARPVYYLQPPGGQSNNQSLNQLNNQNRGKWRNEDDQSNNGGGAMQASVYHDRSLNNQSINQTLNPANRSSQMASPVPQSTTQGNQMNRMSPMAQNNQSVNQMNNQSINTSMLQPNQLAAFLNAQQQMQFAQQSLNQMNNQSITQSMNQMQTPTLSQSLLGMQQQRYPTQQNNQSMNQMYTNQSNMQAINQSINPQMSMMYPQDYNQNQQSRQSGFPFNPATNLSGNQYNVQQSNNQSTNQSTPYYMNTNQQYQQQ